MDSHTDSHQHVQRLAIVETGRRRRFSAGAKLRIVEESFSGPRLGSSTARRHGISVPLLFQWRKAFRAGRLGENRAEQGEAVGFVPAIIAPALVPAPAPFAGGCMEVVSRRG